MKWIKLAIISALSFFLDAKETELISTFSIVARDSQTGEWGVAVQSKLVAVGAIVPFAEAGVGAIATQAWGNPNFGPLDSSF